jgi:hypothetical protein
MPKTSHGNQIHMFPYGLSAKELESFARGIGVAWREMGTGGGQHRVARTALLTDLRIVGTSIWETTYGKGMNDCETELEIQRSYSQAFGMPGDLIDVMLGPATMVQTAFGAKWVHNACPQVVMPHTYAAALMATKVPESMVKDLEPPWDAFVIHVPSGILWVKDPNGSTKVPIDAIMVGRKREQTAKVGTMRAGWMYATVSNSSPVSVWRFGIPAEHLLLDDIEDNPFREHPLAMPYEDSDKALSVLLGRLIVNTILAFQEAGNVKLTKSSRRPATKPTKKNPPEFRTFKLGKPIKLDCRPAIREYLEDPSVVNQWRKGASPTVRFLVRGHKRYQACGPRHSERKLIWIMPHWKGPEGAEVLTRTHEVKVDEDQMKGY